VTLAFKKSLVGAGTFVWGVWAADSMLDPALIDLHDNFTDAAAGSPYQSHSNYPLRPLTWWTTPAGKPSALRRRIPSPGCVTSLNHPQQHPNPPLPTLKHRQLKNLNPLQLLALPLTIQALRVIPVQLIMV